MFVLGGGAVLLTLILIMGVIMPYRNSMALMDTKISSRQRQLEKVQDLRQEYLLLQSRLAVAEEQMSASEGFSLLSFVESVTLRVASKENLVYMRPQPVSTQGELREESAEIKLEKIRLDQLVRFLYSLESAEGNLQMKNLRIKTRFEDKSLLDAVLTISSYRRNA